MSSILRISEGSSLAMHAMAYIANRGGQPCSAAGIAEVLNGSRHHLSKVMQRLSKAGLVRSIRGPSGGFVLADRPQNITLLEVYEAIEGPFRQSQCLLSKKICMGEKCIFGDLLRKTNQMVYEHLKTTRLSDLGGVLCNMKEKEKGEKIR